MKRRHVLLLLLGLCVAFAAHAIDPLKFKDRAQELRFQHLTRELRCLVCQNESLLDSQAELAQQMRHIIYEQMQNGRSDDEIKQYLVDRYSDYVLYDPPLKPSTWLLWFGPGLIVLLGAAGVLFTVRKRARSAPATPPPIDDEDW
ncbi:cytochrome c-type biogenesis protein [Oleiagrimonas sp. MCCC 1A03011]|uniref:cytochrome c-type biogenesis protein n=1 Tax=Oleiagrimonas sp. MCCC 1A03011 TaxID=1926883 RepID=UPI000DC514E1|nr:cytochrome c-type biogenesis protein [Oleiagrimonas sp. MCCC 1A03011]RAP57667.1 cytochrome C biogenesis protein [Oleiagrimonas sp. MCCC 1A03011]